MQDTTFEKQRLRNSISEHMKTQFRAQCSFKNTDAHVHILRKTLMWKHAEDVCMFWPIAGEVNTVPVLRMAQSTKKHLWIPLPHATPQYMRAISYAQRTPQHQRYIDHGVKTLRLHTPAKLQDNPCSIKDISISAWLKHNAHTRMLVLVPGIAFSMCGARLGRGAGFYDRLLSMLEKRTRTCYVVGLCHEMQILPHVPTDEHDKKMMYLVTERRGITCMCT